MLAAATSEGEALQFSSEELRKDKGVVLAAVRNEAGALKYASDELRKDKEVVLAAVGSKGWGTLMYASEE